MCFPLLPKTADKVSDAGFITLGWSLKSSVELTNPVILIQFLILFKSPPAAFFACANIFITHNFEAFWPSSRVKFLPILPFMISPLDLIGSWPDI